MYRSNAPSQSTAAPMRYTNHTDESGLPSEAQLTLLCLDHLRSLRRSYQNKQDLLNGAGLHADHISLAIWSLSRAFACPELAFGSPKVSTVVEEGEEFKVVGGGGVAESTDECVGNDSFYRLLNDSSRNDDSGDDDNIAATPKAMFALTDSIKLPSMKDITNEILLSYSDKAQDDDGSLQYEYYDMHSSNSHRFYLLNGMASQAVDGEPLTLCDLTAVALSTLNAKSRIEAEKEVERDPLFKDFITAAEKNGFFNEKKSANGEEIKQSAEEEALRQRVLYESKYRKVLAKFRSKLAVKEEQEVSNGPLWALKALANAHSVSDRLETRRDKMIEQVKELRVEEEECDVEKASYEELIDDIARLEKKKSKMEMETEALRAVIAEKDAALADANDSNQNLKNDLNDLLDNRSILESKLEDLNNEQAKSQSHIKELIASTERIEEFYKSQVSTVKEELENKKKVLDVANEEIDVLNDALSKEKSLNEALRGDIALKVLEKEELQSKVDDLTAVKAMHEAAIAKAAADIATAGITLEKLQDEITGHVELEAKLQSEIVALTDLKDDNEASLAKAAADIETATKTVEKLQGEITGHVELEAKLQSEIITLTESKAKHEASLAKAAADIETATKTVEKLQGEITGHIELEDKLQSEIVTLTESKAKHEASLAEAADEAAALNAKIEELQDEIISQYNGHVGGKANMKSELEKLSAIRAEKVAALATAAVDIESLEKEIEENRVSISSLLDKLDTATEEISMMQDAEEKLNTKLDEAKAANIAFLDDNAGLEAEINELVKSVESLKEEKFVAGELITIQSKEMEELKMAVENAKELASKSQNAEKELKSMLKEEVTASEALKEEMTKLQATAQNCKDLNASIDFLTESNAALTKMVDDLKLERSGADANVKTLKKDLKKALKVIAKLESNEKKLIEHVLASAQVSVFPKVQTPPRVLPPSPNGVECVPFTPPKSSKKQANPPLPDNGSVAAPPSPPHLTRQAMMNSPSTKKASLASAFPAENLLFHQEAEGINAQGNELMQKKQFSEALASFTTALKLSPDGPNSHIYYTSRAAAYCQLGQYADAADDCRKSIELNDTYEEAYSRYGLCLFHLGDVKGSLAAQKKSFNLARNAYRSDLSTLG